MSEWDTVLLKYSNKIGCNFFYKSKPFSPKRFRKTALQQVHGKYVFELLQFASDPLEAAIFKNKILL